MSTQAPALRHDWSREQIAAYFALPFNDLAALAHSVHRQYHTPNTMQISTLLSVKTGGCPEDCAYCPQAQRYQTGVKAEKLLELDVVLTRAKEAKAAGASRFCMGAAWRSPNDRDVAKVAKLVREVKTLGLETCATLGMLSEAQALHLKDAGLDYYNHNLDTAPEHYQQIISTRSQEQRLETLAHIRMAGLKTCCGGIVGLGETREQRVGLLQSLANLPSHPESVPINQLVQVAGTPLHGTPPIDPFEFVRTIAVARILMPSSRVRLAAGREQMDEGIQAWCFFVGANSIFYGDKLLTTGNPQAAADRALLARLDLKPEENQTTTTTVHTDLLTVAPPSATHAHS